MLKFFFQNSRFLWIKILTKYLLNQIHIWWLRFVFIMQNAFKNHIFKVSLMKTTYLPVKQLPRLWPLFSPSCENMFFFWIRHRYKHTTGMRRWVSTQSSGFYSRAIFLKMREGWHSFMEVTKTLITNFDMTVQKKPSNYICKGIL